jgi:hypothetical protein
VSQDDEALL